MRTREQVEAEIAMMENEILCAQEEVRDYESRD
jgi:hypothetical protein